MQKQTMAKELTKERKERKQDKDEIQNLTVDLISKDTMINNQMGEMNEKDGKVAKNREKAKKAFLAGQEKQQDIMKDLISKGADKIQVDSLFKE